MKKSELKNIIKELIKETLTKKEALENINIDFLTFAADLGGYTKIQPDNTNVVNLDFTKDYGEEAIFEYNLVTRSLMPAMIRRPEDDKAAALYDKLFDEKTKIMRKYIEINPTENKLNENWRLEITPEEMIELEDEGRIEKQDPDGETVFIDYMRTPEYGEVDPDSDWLKENKNKSNKLREFIRNSIKELK